MTTTYDPFNPGLTKAPEDLGPSNADLAAAEVDEALEAMDRGAGPFVNPDAPYGINPDTGRPYRMSPEERKAQGEKLAAGRAAAREAGRSTSGRRKATPGRPASPAAPRATRPPAGPNYRPAATTLLLIPATVTAVLGRVTGNRAFLADSATFTLHTPSLADAAHDMALEDARVAALLDRVGKVSPFGAFAAAAGAMVLQLLANHRIIGPAETMGILPMDKLIGPEPEVARDSTDAGHDQQG